jgi:hypothetical protein
VGQQARIKAQRRAMLVHDGARAVVSAMAQDAWRARGGALEAEPATMAAIKRDWTAARILLARRQRHEPRHEAWLLRSARNRKYRVLRVGVVLRREGDPIDVTQSGQAVADPLTRK